MRLLFVLLLAACVVVSMSSLQGCKSRGTFTIEIDFEEGTCEGRDQASELRIYMIKGASCSTCECGSCWDLCGEEDCIVGCQGGLCDVDDLAGGIDLDPNDSGSFAVVYDYFFTDVGGAQRLGASACADVTLEKDGTDSAVFPVPGVCCFGAAPAVDAGTADGS